MIRLVSGEAYKNFFIFAFHVGFNISHTGKDSIARRLCLTYRPMIRCDIRLCLPVRIHSVLPLHFGLKYLAIRLSYPATQWPTAQRCCPSCNSYSTRHRFQIYFQIRKRQRFTLGRARCSFNRLLIGQCQRAHGCATRSWHLRFRKEVLDYLYTLMAFENSKSTRKSCCCSHWDFCLGLYSLR